MWAMVKSGENGKDKEDLQMFVASDKENVLKVFEPWMFSKHDVITTAYFKEWVCEEVRCIDICDWLNCTIDYAIRRNKYSENHNYPHYCMIDGSLYEMTESRVVELVRYWCGDEPADIVHQAALKSMPMRYENTKYFAKK